MGKVYRQDKKSVQRIRARDIVPGDIVEVAGKQTNYFFQHHHPYYTINIKALQATNMKTQSSATAYLQLLNSGFKFQNVPFHSLWMFRD